MTGMVTPAAQRLHRRAIVTKSIGILGRLRFSGLLFAIVAAGIVFTILSPQQSFAHSANLIGLLRSMSTISIVAFGATLVIVVGEIDLSFGYMYGLAGMLIAVPWLMWGWPVWAAILLSLGAAAVLGLINALLVTVAGIPSFIVTLGTGALVFGMTLLISDAKSYSSNFAPSGRVINKEQQDVFNGISNMHLPFGFPAQALWMLVAAVLFGFLLSYSLFGFRLKAIGGNAVAARIARLPVRRYTGWAFVLASVCAALAALLDFSFIGSVQPDGGQSLLFPVFAAVIIGGASLTGGKGTIVGTLSGGLLLAVLTNGFALLSVGSYAQQIFLGSVTIAAVVLDRLSNGKAR